MSGYSADFIQEKLEKELETIHCEVKDMSDGCGGKFECVIVSAKFEGKPLLQRHRLVNGVLEEELKKIHVIIFIFIYLGLQNGNLYLFFHLQAFSQKTLTPEQWEKQKQ